MYDVIALDKRMTAFVIPNAIQVTTRSTKYTFTSFLSRDTTFDVIYNVWHLARPDDSASQLASARASLEQSNGSSESAAVAVNGKAKAKAVNKVTQCACGKNGEHYSETAMETVFPGTPEKIYNLMFTSGFIKEFMRDGQKLIGKETCLVLAAQPFMSSSCLGRYPNLRLGTDPKQSDTSRQEHVVHQTSNGEHWSEAD